MSIVLTTLNAKYSHSSLALRYLEKYYKSHHNFKTKIKIMEFTINNSDNYILQELYKQKPNIIGFSCYIWNIEMILNIIKNLKKILPKTIFILGGLEVSFNFKEILINNPVDVIVIEEGEEAFCELMDYYINKKNSLEEIKGIAYRKNDEIIVNKKEDKNIDINKIPFVYEDNINDFENKIIYYETSRGCPFRCQYCMSSIDNNVRFLNIDRCLKELQFFLDNNVRQVKFIDRTFNCNKKHTIAIWNYLLNNDNGITNFHFEIAADLIDEEMLNLLKKARIGYFQFEIGIQSTNPKVLEEIQRKTNLQKVFYNIKQIKKIGNIHQHLDLIVGLPLENYLSFKNSFNDVYILEPEQLQIGFLKVLHGSGIKEKAEQYSIVYKYNTPYEVLYTNELSFDEIIGLKNIEEVVETFYNSNKFHFTLKFIINFYETPFDFYKNFSEYCYTNNFYATPHNKLTLYKIMYDFCVHYFNNYINIISDLIKFDMMLNDNVVNVPDWLNSNIDDFEKQKIRLFIKNYSGNENNKLTRKLHIEKFYYNIIDFSFTKGDNIQNIDTYILFNYLQPKNAITGFYDYKRVWSKDNND